MNILNLLLSNGFIPIIPILLWNLILGMYLPHPFNSKEFDTNIPKTILFGENIFRFIIFVLPVFIKTNIHSAFGKFGLFFYITGTILYILSWLALIIFPNSKWSKSAFGFTAPSYTPVIWLFGLSFMYNSYYFNIPYFSWEYLVPAFLMIIFHFSHTRMSFQNNKKK